MKKLILIISVIALLYSQNLSAQFTKADTIHVLHYDINLEIRNFSKQEINGYTDVVIEAKIASLTSINLDFMKLSVDSIKKGDDPIPFLHQGEKLTIVLPFSSVGQTESIRVYYHGKPFKESWGGFLFSGTSFAYNMGVGMNTTPHPLGRVWYPCIDDFKDKSTYTFNIVTDADKKAICGGILVDSMNINDDAMLWKWELTDPIPTYLASVAVASYEAYRDTIISISGDTLPIEIYTTAANMQNVSGSFVNLKTFIRTYEKRWGPCRWQRVGYVAVPFRQGAMEHATNIAYPISDINGNTNYESTIAHELAHSWFGNLITCSTAQNMWINEGFATYGEYLCDEALDSTLETYKKNIKDLHFSVLKQEGGKYALDNVPNNDTYRSITVYKKGGLVAYTLRNYMGDDLYFSSITTFFEQNQYGNVTSEEFFDKLSEISGMDLHDFFLGWVHQRGFLNFNIDSIKQIAGSNKYQISFKQKLYRAEYFANNNLVDVEFVSDSNKRYLVEKINFSGESDTIELELPFEPAFWAIDPNGKMGDACFDATKEIVKTGSVSMGDQYFSILVNKITDTVLLRVEYNPVPPTAAKNMPPNVIKISNTHFWRVGFLQYNTIDAAYSFSYNSTYDNDFVDFYQDLVLLYRKDAAHDWQIIPATVTGNTSSGKVTTNEIYPGEYTFGIFNNLNINNLNNNIELYPNPVHNKLEIKNYELRIDKINIYDITGKQIIFNFQFSNSIDVSPLTPGIYILEVVSKNNKTFKKFIKL